MGGETAEQGSGIETETRIHGHTEVHRGTQRHTEAHRGTHTHPHTQAHTHTHSTILQITKQKWAGERLTPAVSVDRAGSRRWQQLGVDTAWVRSARRFVWSRAAARLPAGARSGPLGSLARSVGKREEKKRQGEENGDVSVCCE